MVYVPIAPPQCTKMGPQRRLGIYIGHDFPSIIKYLKLMIRNVFMTHFVSYHFDELVFPTLRGEKEKQLVWF